MKVTEAKLLAFLQVSPQFVIPTYQRTYPCTDSQYRLLCEDSLQAGSSDAIASQPLDTLEGICPGTLAIEHEAEGLLGAIIGGGRA